MKRPSRFFVSAALLLAVFSTAGNPAVSLASEMEEPAVPVLAETVTDPLAQDDLDVEDAMVGEDGPLGTEDGDPPAGNDPADLVADASGPGQEDDGDPGVSDGADLEDPTPTTPIGWVQRNGQTHFLLADGTPLKFAQTIDGKQYYFWSDGQLARDVLWQGRYYGPDGTMYVSRWFTIGPDRYYAHYNGGLAKGMAGIDGKVYYFWSGGQLARNVIWQDRGYGPDGAMYHGCWFIIGNGQYYAHSNGALAKGQTDVRGKVYYFWSDGTMACNALWQNKCYGPDGAMLSNDWLRFNGNTYYADGLGSPVRFAQTIDGEKCYFWSDGAMAHDCMFQGHYYLSDGKMARFQWVDNEQYWVDADGNWVPNMPAKVGWQNPAGYYQVSSKGPYLGIPSEYYVTSTRINPHSTRDECVETFIQRAWEYVGTPYVWNYSNAPGVGVDCIGLVYQCAYACGMNLGEFNPYDHWITGPYGWHSHDANNMWHYGAIQRLSLGSRNRGDLIFWRGHVAIYLGNDRILEAYPGVVRETSLWAHGTPIGVGRLFL